MTVAAIIPGEGTLFQVSIASTFTTIAQVHEVTGPDMLVKAVETTVLGSALVSHRPSKLANPDKVSLKLFFDANDTTTQSLITGDLNAPGTIRQFKIVFDDGKTTPSNADFSGFFTSGKLNGMKNEENVGMDVEIKPTTIITFTPGS